MHARNVSERGGTARVYDAKKNGTRLLIIRNYHCASGPLCKRHERSTRELNSRPDDIYFAICTVSLRGNRKFEIDIFNASALKLCGKGKEPVAFARRAELARVLPPEAHTNPLAFR